MATTCVRGGGSWLIGVVKQMAECGRLSNHGFDLATRIPVKPAIIVFRDVAIDSHADKKRSFAVKCS